MTVDIKLNSMIDAMGRLDHDLGVRAVLMALRNAKED